MLMRFPVPVFSVEAGILAPNDTGKRGSKDFGWWHSDLIGKVIPGAITRIELTAPLKWEDPDGRIVVVGAGFVSDGASKPWYTRSFIGGRFDKADVRAAVVHDFGIRMRYDSPSVVHKRFYNGCRADGVPAWLAHVEYRAVQIGVRPWEPTRETDHTTTP